MSTDNKDSNDRNLRGLFGFIPHVFIIILLLLVMRCEPFSVAVNDDQETQEFVSGEESFKRGGFWRRAWNTITLEATPIPDKGVWTITKEGVVLVPKDDTTPIPDKGVWTITKEGVVLLFADDITPKAPVVKSKEAPVPATATPVPTPNPTSEPSSGAEAVKLLLLILHQLLLRHLFPLPYQPLNPLLSRIFLLEEEGVVGILLLHLYLL